MSAVDLTSRRAKIVSTAQYLATRHSALIGWAPTDAGKVVKRHWKSDMTSDPGVIAGMLAGNVNSLIVARNELLIIDVDGFGTYEELRAAGLPGPDETLTVQTPTKRTGPGGETYQGCHVYTLLPAGTKPDDVPATFAGGETRRSNNGEQNMVLGPWSLTSSGVYTPLGTAQIVRAPESVIEYLKSHQIGVVNHGATNGLDISAKLRPWQWQDVVNPGSRHDHVRGLIRGWRGSESDPEKLTDKGMAYIELHAIPTGRNGDEPDLDRAEVYRMATGAVRKYDDDPPLSSAPVGHQRKGVSAREFATAAASAVQDDLLAGIIPAGSLVLHSGQPKSLKTWMALDMATAMFQGRDLLGRGTKRIERFVYATREDSDFNISDRIVLFDSLADGSLLDDAIVIRDIIPLHSSHIEAWKIELEPCLGQRTYLVIDPLRDFIAHGSEKDDDTIREVKQACRDLQSWHGDLTIHLIHHNTKAQLYGDHRDASGSGALSAMADVLIQHRRDRQDEEEDEDEALITITGSVTGSMTVVGRSIEGGRIKWRWVGPGFELTSAAPGKDAVLTALSELSRGGAGVSVKAVADRVGKNPKSVRTTLTREVKKSLVTLSGGLYWPVEPAPVRAQRKEDSVSGRFYDIFHPEEKTAESTEQDTVPD